MREVYLLITRVTGIEKDILPKSAYRLYWRIEGALNSIRDA